MPTERKEMELNRRTFLRGVTATLAISASGVAMALPIEPISKTVLAGPGWIVCNGQALLCSEYADLFRVIGYSYGGSGQTFNVPSVRMLICSIPFK